jgi:predicted transcriptional regulator
VYQAAQREDETQQCLVKDLLHKAFGGSAKALVMQALEAEPASKEELEDIRRLLKKAGGK